VDGGGCQVALDGKLPTVAKEAVGKGGFTVECYGKSMRVDATLAESSDSVTCYKCKTNFDWPLPPKATTTPPPQARSACALDTPSRRNVPQ